MRVAAAEEPPRGPSQEASPPAEVRAAEDAAAAVEAPPEPPKARPSGDLRLEVDKSSRTLKVWVGEEVVATHKVAIGQPRYATPSGHYAIRQVDWNPDWTPPSGDWAREQAIAIFMARPRGRAIDPGIRDGSAPSPAAPEDSGRLHPRQRPAGRIRAFGSSSRGRGEAADPLRSSPG